MFLIAAPIGIHIGINQGHEGVKQKITYMTHKKTSKFGPQFTDPIDPRIANKMTVNGYVGLSLTVSPHLFVQWNILGGRTFFCSNDFAIPAYLGAEMLLGAQTRRVLFGALIGVQFSEHKFYQIKAHLKRQLIHLRRQNAGSLSVGASGFIGIFLGCQLNESWRLIARCQYSMLPETDSGYKDYSYPLRNSVYDTVEEKRASVKTQYRCMGVRTTLGVEWGRAF